MKDITKMTLNEMLDAGVSVGDIMKSYHDIAATKVKEQEAKKAAEAAEKARQEEIAAARRQYKKAHAKYMKAITGTDMSAEDMAEFENSVLLPMEQVWEREFAPKLPAANKRKVLVNGAEVASEDDLVRAIMKAIGEF